MRARQSPALQESTSAKAVRTTKLGRLQVAFPDGRNVPATLLGLTSAKDLPALFLVGMSLEHSGKGLFSPEINFGVD